VSPAKVARQLNAALIWINRLQVRPGHLGPPAGYPFHFLRPLPICGHPREASNLKRWPGAAERVGPAALDSALLLRAAPRT
jgi:hypothetical protein